LMSLQITVPTEWLITHIADIWLLPTMYALMCLQITLPTEWLITHITEIRTIPTMCALVCLQMTFCAEWLVTHITGIRVTLIMCKLSFIHRPLPMWEIIIRYYKLHSVPHPIRELEISESCAVNDSIIIIPIHFYNTGHSEWHMKVTVEHFFEEWQTI
jgi:hypothetical protein